MLTVFRIFVERDAWLPNAKSYCAMFCWGGRTEQEIAEALRKKQVSLQAHQLSIRNDDS